MKMLLQVRGLDPKGRKMAREDMVKALVFPQEADPSTGRVGSSQSTLESSAPAATSRTFHTTGCSKLVDESAGLLTLEFTRGSTMLHSVARKESDRLPSENMRRVSLRSYGGRLLSGLEVTVIKSRDNPTELYFEVLLQSEDEDKGKIKI